VYSAAADREQAAIVFDVAKQMVLQSNSCVRASSIAAPWSSQSASSYKVLFADAFTSMA
jgi:hypothetical protein